MPTLTELFKTGAISFQELLQKSQEMATYENSYNSGKSLSSNIDTLATMLQNNNTYTPFAAATIYSTDQIKAMLNAGIPLSIGTTDRWIVSDGQGGFKEISGNLFAGNNGIFDSIPEATRLAWANTINQIAPTHHTLSYVEEYKKGNTLTNGWITSGNSSYDYNPLDFGPFTGTGAVNNTDTGAVDNTGGVGQEDEATQETTQKSKASPYVPPPFKAQSSIGGYHGDPKQSILGGLGGNFFAGQTNMVGALGNTNPNTGNGSTTSAQTGPFAGQSGSIAPYNINNSGATQGQNQTNLGLGDAAFNLGQAFNTSPAGQSGYLR